MGAFDVLLDDERTQFDAFVEDYRNAVEANLDGLTEEQVRRRLVSSATTLLGVVKHVTWMQRIWFEQCIGGMARGDLSLAQTVDESYQLDDDDTIASVTTAHRKACTTARKTVADRPLDAVVAGHPTGPPVTVFAPSEDALPWTPLSPVTRPVPSVSSSREAG